MNRLDNTEHRCRWKHLYERSPPPPPFALSFWSYGRDRLVDGQLNTFKSLEPQSSTDLYGYVQVLVPLAHTQDDQTLALLPCYYFTAFIWLSCAGTRWYLGVFYVQIDLFYPLKITPTQFYVKVSILCSPSTPFANLSWLMQCTSDIFPVFVFVFKPSAHSFAAILLKSLACYFLTWKWLR